MCFFLENMCAELTILRKTVAYIEKDESMKHSKKSFPLNFCILDNAFGKIAVAY